MDLDYTVEKPGLVPIPEGLGFVKGGNLSQAVLFPVRKPPDRTGKDGFPVAQIGL